MRVYEQSDGCLTVAITDGIHRIIRCRDNIQWIVQQRTSPNGKRPWSSLAFCATKRGLEIATNALDLGNPIACWVGWLPEPETEPFNDVTHLRNGRAA
ncbi:MULTISPECIES: hypothetical protein [unclassified Ruegeria]|uniref:hypothetical protein n=1 Tax=unclassified Ruegeria TaxID=2625375 RepID=UPI0014898C4D|nr:MULTISPECIES: hypothetical protein [unclassified Ruegeria]